MRGRTTRAQAELLQIDPFPGVEDSRVTADPSHVLQTLRWAPDQLHVEPIEEELTWLAAIVFSDGRRAMTDCCLASAPCPYHAAIEAGESPCPWVPSLEFVQHWAGVRARFDWSAAQ